MKTKHLVPGGTGRVHPLQTKLMAKKMKKKTSPIDEALAGERWGDAKKSAAIRGAIHDRAKGYNK